MLQCAGCSFFFFVTFSNITASPLLILGLIESDPIPNIKCGKNPDIKQATNNITTAIGISNNVKLLLANS